MTLNIAYVAFLLLATVQAASVSTSNCLTTPNVACVCTTTGGTADCSSLTDSANLKSTFASKPKKTVDIITILFSSGLTSLPSEVFGQVSTKAIEIGKTGLSTVHDDAFKGSENTLETIALNDNKLVEFNFKSLHNLHKLNSFRLSNDGLTRVPEDAFADFPFLEFVDLAGNSISTVAKQTFANLPLIHTINLSQNKLIDVDAEVFSLPKATKDVTINLASNHIATIHKDAFKGVKLRSLDLENNKLETLDQDVFENLLDSLGNQQAGGLIHTKGNPFKCDESIRWLVKKNAQYKRRITNFKCKDSGKRLSQLTESDLAH